MKKSELINRADKVIAETREALQTVYGSLNRGQQIQLAKDKSVKALFDRYGVEYTS